MRFDRRQLEVGPASTRVRSYFTEPSEAEPFFGGARFERWGAPTAAEANTVTSDDLLAVSLLGPPVPGHAVIRILDTDAKPISKCLKAISPDRPLWKFAVDDLYDPDQPYLRLWRLVSAPRGMGPARTSKLLARKRPKLFPIFDSVTGPVVGSSLAHWRNVHALVSDEDIRSRLRAIRKEAGVGKDISLLRILDVAVWMKRAGDEQLRARA